ncbi:hypothetical protein D3C77_313160 [compost metagenome]
MKKTRAALSLCGWTQSMATLSPCSASIFLTSSGIGKTPSWRTSTLSTSGLNSCSSSSWNDQIAPVMPINASTRPAVIPKNQCS